MKEFGFGREFEGGFCWSRFASVGFKSWGTFAGWRPVEPLERFEELLGGFPRPVAGRWAGYQPVGISSGASWNIRCGLNANAAQQASHFTFAKPLVENRHNLNFVLIQAFGNSTSGARFL